LRRRDPLVWAEDEAAAPPPAQLLWANMALHLMPDPPATFAAWHRLTAVDGFLMFSTLGPGSLTALGALYAARGWPPPHAPFVDMHDLGDMLVRAGFAEPVMDQETITLHWADAPALLAELRSLGGNASPQRPSGLRGRAWQRELHDAMGTLARSDGRPALAFEVVYGHAFRPPPRPRVDGVTTLGVDELREMARAAPPRRRPGGGSAGNDPTLR
jgi:malonyl-CoA O-methyltransferase